MRLSAPAHANSLPWAHSDLPGNIQGVMGMCIRFLFVSIPFASTEIHAKRICCPSRRNTRQVCVLRNGWSCSTNENDQITRKSFAGASGVWLACSGSVFLPKQRWFLNPSSCQTSGQHHTNLSFQTRAGPVSLLFKLQISKLATVVLCALRFLI